VAFIRDLETRPGKFADFVVVQDIPAGTVSHRCRNCVTPRTYAMITSDKADTVAMETIMRGKKSDAMRPGGSSRKLSSRRRLRSDSRQRSPSCGRIIVITMKSIILTLLAAGLCLSSGCSVSRSPVSLPPTSNRTSFSEAATIGVATVAGAAAGHAIRDDALGPPSGPSPAW
jgi:hypothetical protein